MAFTVIKVKDIFTQTVYLCVVFNIPLTIYIYYIVIFRALKWKLQLGSDNLTAIERKNIARNLRRNL